jgi:hypothetical protein
MTRVAPIISFRPYIILIGYKMKMETHVSNIYAHCIDTTSQFGWQRACAYHMCPRSRKIVSMRQKGVEACMREGEYRAYLQKSNLGSY